MLTGIHRPGEYGQDIYTLRSTYFQGRVPPSVNMYWRRFEVSSIPVSSPSEFEIWVRERWLEKDRLLEQFNTTGRFPADEGEDYVARGALTTVESSSPAKAQSKVPTLGPGGYRYLETEVRNKWAAEWLIVFAPLFVWWAVFWGLLHLWRNQPLWMSATVAWIIQCYVWLRSMSYFWNMK